MARERELDLTFYPNAPRKWFGNGEYGGKRLPARLIGMLQDGSLCWKPCGNTMSAWVRVEPSNGGKACFLYNPGGSFKPYAPRVSQPEGPWEPSSVQWFNHCRRVPGTYKVGESVYHCGSDERYAGTITRIETTHSPDGRAHDYLWLRLQSVDGKMREYEYRAADVVYATGSASPLTV